MLYSNFRIPIEPRQTPEGNFRGAVMGQFQAGSRRFYLETPRKAGNFIKGDRPDLSVITDTSKPERHIWHIAKTARATAHLILSSRHFDEKDFGTGCILAPARQSVQVVDYATSGRATHASWQVVLLDASPGDIFVVRIHTNRSVLHRCYIVGDKQVIEVAKESLAASYETQLDQMKRTQCRHAAVDLQDYWSNVLAPHAGNCRLF